MTGLVESAKTGQILAEQFGQHLPTPCALRYHLTIGSNRISGIGTFTTDSKRVSPFARPRDIDRRQAVRRKAHFLKAEALAS